MKTASSAILILLLTCQATLGQWYQRHYGVDHPGALTSYQLKQSTRRAVVNIGIGAFTMAGGSIIMITGQEKLDPETNPPLSDIFRSPDAIGYAITGAVVFSAGAAVLLANSTRLVRIGIAKSKLYALDTRIEIKPVLRANNHLSCVEPGVTVSIYF